MSDPEALSVVLARTMLRIMPGSYVDGPACMWTDQETRAVRELIRRQLDELVTLDRWQHMYPELRSA